MDNIDFQIEYVIDKDTYYYSATHPVSLNGKLNSILEKSILIAGFISLFLCFISVLLNRSLMYYNISLIFLMILAFLVPKIRRHNNYKFYTKFYKEKFWKKTVSIGEKIEIVDGNSVATFDLCDIVKITENSKYFYLWINENFQIGILKDHFTTGNQDEFRNYISSKIVSPLNEDKFKKKLITGGILRVLSTFVLFLLVNHKLLIYLYDYIVWYFL